jgi:hypothetical protein
MENEMKVDAPMAAAMTATAAATLAELWLRSNPSAARHLESGWHISAEVIVTTDPMLLKICFVDPADGKRFPQLHIPIPRPANA